MTMTLIETKTLGSTQASIEFTSIPQDATDLLAVMSLRSSLGSEGRQTYLEINGSAANFTMRFLYGSGSAVGSGAESVGYAGFYSGSTDTANTFGNNSLYIANYTSSVAKSMSIDSVFENNATAAYQGMWAQLWNNTAAITSLLFKPTSPASWVAGSTISLYKITKGSSGGVVVS